MKLIFLLLGLIYSIQSVYAEVPFINSLSPLKEMAGSYDFYTRIIVFILSLVLFIISLKAYFKSKTQKVLFVSIAFGLFAVKWLIKVIDLFVLPHLFFNDASENVFELFILASLFYALFVKK